MTERMIKRTFAVPVFLLQVFFAYNTLAQRPLSSLPKMPPEPLKADVLLLKKILEANHPSLYWYTPKDSVDWYFNHTVQGITDSLNDVDFKNRVACLVSKIRCGHTVVRFSKAYRKIAAGYRFPLFPLALKAWNDSLVVLANIGTKDSVFKRGTIITAINGKSNRQLLDSIYQFISTDGYSENYKSQLVSTNFPGWYKTILGSDSAYDINYIDTTGKEAVAHVRGFNPLTDTTHKGHKSAASLIRKPSRHRQRQLRLLEKRSMVIDTAGSTAFIRLTTFTDGRLQRFFRRSFKTIDRERLQNLVIDMRENGGGRVGNSITLTQYLTQQPFKVADSVVAVSRKFKYGRYIKPAWIYRIAMNMVGRKMKDGLIHFRHYERHFFQPKAQYHFNGHVYLVQGGLTFSAASICIATLKGQNNIKVVGEESGGGYYGTSAMHIPVITLPHTGLQVSLPMYRLVMNSLHPKGHGVMPDIEVEPSSEAIKKGIDLKMETIKERIQRNAF